MYISNDGDNCIDVGANIGYMTGLILKRIGTSGKIYSFELHPETYNRLLDNIRKYFSSSYNYTISDVALSNNSGKATLQENPFDSGQASLAQNTDSSNHKTYTVTKGKLQDIVDVNLIFKLMKLDVEGHELQVLQGAEKLLENQLIRNILFENHTP